jgi:deoxycytidylate deaminase
MNIELFLDYAKVVAQSSNHPHYKHGCVCINNHGQIVSAASNRIIKSHPYQKRMSKNPMMIYPHAETLSIIRARGRSQEQEIKYMFVVRIGRDCEFKLSKPCPTCTYMIFNETPIKNVYYHNSKNKICVINANLDF